MRAAPLSLALLVLVSCYSSTTGFLLVPSSSLMHRSIISPNTSTSLSSKGSSHSSKRLPYKIAAAASLSLVTVGLPKVVTAAGGTAPVQEVTKIAKEAFSPKEIIKKSPAISPTSGSLALKKSSGIPVFMVCTRWGSPFMVYGPTGKPTALYFLNPDDAYTMSQEFLQLPSMASGRQSIHIMSTNMERALRQVTAKDVPTGSVGEGDGKVETMEYKLVGGGKERWQAKQLKQQAQEKSVKKAQKLATQQKDAGIPIFTVDGLTNKKGETLLFFSLDDLNKAWTASKISGRPDIEVFDFVDVLKSMEESPEAFKSVKFVSSSQAVEYKNGITKKGNNQAKLPRMR